VLPAVAFEAVSTEIAATGCRSGSRATPTSALDPSGTIVSLDRK
jgi:hypothetical protein